MPKTKLSESLIPIKELSSHLKNNQGEISYSSLGRLHLDNASAALGPMQTRI